MLASILSEPMTPARWLLAFVFLVLAVPAEVVLIVGAKSLRTKP